MPSLAAQYGELELLEVVGAVNFGGFEEVLGDVGDEVAEYENGEGLSAGGADEDEGGEGVEEVHVAQEDEEGDEVGDHGHHHEEQEGVPEEGGEGDFEAGEEVGAGESEDDDEEGGGGG